MTGGRSRWWATVALVAALAGGCSSGRSDLGTSNGPCYVALPAATTAVHGKGNLVGVHRATVVGLHRSESLYEVASRGGRSGGSQVCLVAWSGHFRADQVDQPAGRATGRLAVVVVTYPGNQVQGTVLLRRFPIEFGHARLGPS